jgi:hypothetical protein
MNFLKKYKKPVVLFSALSFLTVKVLVPFGLCGSPLLLNLRQLNEVSKAFKKDLS